MAPVTDRQAGTSLFGRFLLPYSWPLAVAAILAVAETVVDLARPWPLQLAVDHAIGHRPLGGWFGVMLAPLDGHSPLAIGAVAAVMMVGLAALSTVIGYLTTYLTGATAERIGADLRATIHHELLRLSPRFHDRNQTGDLLTRLTGDVSRVQDVLVAWLATLLPEGLTLLGMLIIVFAIDPLMALTALVVTPPLVILIARKRQRIRPLQRVSRDQQGLLAAEVTERLRNVRVVQAFAREIEEHRHFLRRNRTATQSSLAVLDLGARYGPTADIVLAGGAALVIWLGVVRVASGRMTLGVLLVVLSYLGGLYSPIRSLTRLSSTLAKGLASRERIVEILQCREAVRESENAQPFGGLEHALEFHEVFFAYQPGVSVLKGLTLTVCAEETVCIIGPTGAGKSTLLSLIVRLYDPDRGAIEMDGIDLRHFALRSLRERIALVPQDPWIIDGSIRDNISFGRRDATEEELRAAARLALVDEFASRLPDGYGYRVGECGALLSGGQRRRLALARALVREAAIVLLDEPTSGLDAAAAAEVMEAIRRVARERTLIIVTHQLSIAAAADRVAILRDGRIVEEGSPSRLLASEEIIRALSAWQQPVPSVVRATKDGLFSARNLVFIASRSTQQQGGDTDV